MRVLVAGMVAADPHQGGATWAVLQYVYGLEELGHEVWTCDPAEPGDESAAYFTSLDLGPRASFGRYDGPVPDVLLNISGTLRDHPILEKAPIRVFLDLDPVFNQLWHRQAVDVGLDGHTHHVSVGLHVPPTGHDWIHTLPPVVLGRWPVAEQVELDAFTTVANLRGYGSIEHDGVRYGQKAHSLRTVIDLPERSTERFALALSIHPDEPDRVALEQHGWNLVDPRDVAGTPDAYAAFVRGSTAEIGIAKEGYVVGRCGWFSDRSSVYLASGRPVVAQDTGFGESLPTGAGLFAFSDVDGALAAIERLRIDYGRHARAARAIAEEYLDAKRVLGRLLEEVGAVRPARHRRIHEVPAADLAALLGVETVKRRPFEYRSSAPLVEVEVGDRTLIVKDLSPAALTAEARAAKLGFLHDPRREIDVYRRLLAGAGLGTAEFSAAVVDERRGRYWLAIERVDGTELYQVGEIDRWADALRWLARCHDRFAGLARADYLVPYDHDFFVLWPERAGVDLAGYDAVVRRLAALPTTLVHGELYASNVLVSDDRVCPVDWELAGIGPGVLDVAALTMGWPEAERAVLAESYRKALADPPDAERFAGDLDCASLHLAVQWLGWSPEWAPPPEHARDWRGELAVLAERAGL